MMFCCSRSLVSGVQCDVEKCLMQLYVGPCHVVNAEIALTMAVPIENPVFCRLMRSYVILMKMQALTWNYSVARQCMSAYCPSDTSLAS